MIRHKERLIIEDTVCVDEPFDETWDIDSEEREMINTTYLDYDDYALECEIEYEKECDEYRKDFEELFNKK